MVAQARSDRLRASRPPAAHEAIKDCWNNGQGMSNFDVLSDTEPELAQRVSNRLFH